MQYSSALACLEKALPLHASKSWYLMEDHIRFQLGTELARRQSWSDAMAQFSGLLHSTQVDSGYHATYLDQFVNAYKVRFEL